MNEEELRDKLIELSKVVECDEYPQTADTISKLLLGYVDNAVDVVSALEKSDKNKAFHPAVSEFIEDFLLKEIDKQDSDSALFLGAIYYSGRIGQQDFEKAVKYYLMASNWGNPKADENLGYCYYYGRLGEVDYEKAFYHFSKCAFIGMPISLYKIGDMYKNGYYVEKDESHAFEIYNYALYVCDKDPDGEYRETKCDIYMRIADFLADGDVVKQDYDTAVELYAFSMNEFRKRIMNNGEHFLKSNYEHCKQMVKKISEILENDFPQWNPQDNLN